MSRNSFRGLVLGLSLLVATATTVRANLLSYEPFGYSGIGADLQGSSGAGSFGFATPWVPGGFNATISDNYDIAAGSLTFGNLLTSGNRATSAAVNAIAGLTRDFAIPIGETGQTRYFSFLIRPEGTLNGGAFNGFFGVTLEFVDEPELFTGKPGADALTQYVIEDRGGAFQHASPVPVVIGQTALLVVKAEFMNQLEPDRFTLYVDPIPGGPEPAIGTIKFDSGMTIATGFTLYSTGAFSVDELRMGQTFADVTPAVPEPAALAIVLLPALAALARRRIIH
ncbi:MAG TPA: hypothetical protein VGQ99_17905 [Tepidisphaeraceae bacterium]|jgi:hypothetical protein|nr:hypothetical protein [Tepidisphaeraceae bacterium]